MRSAFSRTLVSADAVTGFRYAAVPGVNLGFSSIARQMSKKSLFETSNLPTASSTSLPTPPNFGFAIVPQQRAYIVERLGKFERLLTPGLHFLIPIIDRIAYVHSLKETSIGITNQTAITADNVTIQMDGVLYYRIVDAEKASYGIDNLESSVIALAQTSMRAEIGKLTLDKTFAERETLNQKIVDAMNKATDPWGVQCLRYEIRDITPPETVKIAMDRQAQAERTKRATILDSEGARQADINVAEGQRQAVILAATADADATVARATAAAKSIELVANALDAPGGRDAISFRLAEKYIEAFSQLAQKSTTLVLPADAADPSSMVASAATIFSRISQQTAATASAELAEQVLRDKPFSVANAAKEEARLKAKKSAA